MTDSPSRGLSDAIARHVSGVRFEHLPVQTVLATKRALLDAVGVMSAASALAPETRPFLDLARASGGRPEASILGTGDRVPATLAAFANGALAHALDYEDAFDAAPVHPNASLIPAVLALAQARAPVSGRELLTAITVGCDFACRLALSLRRRLEDGGWYPPPILGAFGAVAGAARLLRLSPRQVVDAFSLLLLQNSCPGEIKYSAETMIRAVREAFPAQAAVTVTLLAEAGVRGFDAPLEGRAGFYALFAGGHYAPGDLLNDLGSRWHIDDLSFKPWPSCRGTHAAIEAALMLRAHEALDPALIDAVTIEGGSRQAMLAEPRARKRAPQTGIDAKFSLPFTVATALQYGEVTLDRFGTAGLADPAVLALAARCDWRERADWGPDHAVAGGIRILMRDGRGFAFEVPDPSGSPARPLDDARLTAKFVDCLGRAARPLRPDEATGLAARILRIDDEVDVAPLF
jgi:2-methylcitrate dehydratase PrpD